MSADHSDHFHRGYFDEFKLIKEWEDFLNSDPVTKLPSALEISNFKSNLKLVEVKMSGKTFNIKPIITNSDIDYNIKLIKKHLKKKK